jgi:hypothetical protein
MLRITQSLPLLTQGVLLLITIILGLYVYGLRGVNWEKSVDDARKEFDKDVTNVIIKSSSITNDGSEVKL